MLSCKLFFVDFFKISLIYENNTVCLRQKKNNKK